MEKTLSKEKGCNTHMTRRARLLRTLNPGH
jgi:hypothetical protein